MNFQSIANALGIPAYPEALNEVYEALPPGENAVTDAFITGLEETYGILGKYTEELRQAARDLQKDEVRLAFVNTVCEYLPTTDCAGTRAIPMPKTDGTLAGNMLPLLILLSQVPAAYGEYVSRGFSEAETKELMGAFCRAIRTVEQRFHLHGINGGFYVWLCLYMKCRIFRTGIFNIEMKALSPAAICLQNRVTGETAVLLCEGRFHRSGRVLGAAGCTDAEGAFDAAFSETEEAFVGHPAKAGLVSPEVAVFPKDRWEAAARPGDDVISLHIPGGVALTAENIRSSVTDALALAKERYPECNPRGVHCSSWLLDPALGTLLGDTSRIVGFGNTFHRYPTKSDGLELFSFVFPGADTAKLSGLPEDTSLQRKLKALYLAGGFVYQTAGIFLR